MYDFGCLLQVGDGREAGGILFEEAIDGVLGEDGLDDVAVGSVDGVGRGGELAEEILLLDRRQELAHGDGSSAGKGECQASVDGLGRQGTTVGGSGQEVLEQVLRVESFESGRNTEDADSSPAEVAEVETQGLEVGVHGSEGGGIGGRELDDIGKEQSLGGQG